MSQPLFSAAPDTDGTRVAYGVEPDGDRGRIVGWQDEEVALVMWPGNDFPEEEYAADLVVIKGD